MPGIDRFICPNCDARAKPDADVRVGDRIICPKCGKRFVLEEGDVLAGRRASGESKRTQDRTANSRRESDAEDDIGLYQTLKRNVWFRLGTLALLVIILGALGHRLYKKRLADREAEEYNRKNAAYLQEGVDFKAPMPKGFKQRSNFVVPDVDDVTEQRLLPVVDRLVGNWENIEVSELHGTMKSCEFRKDTVFSADVTYVFPNEKPTILKESASWKLKTGDKDSGEFNLTNRQSRTTQVVRYRFEDNGTIMILEFPDREGFKFKRKS